MKNYRVANTCLNCRFHIEEVAEDIFNDLYCNSDKAVPCSPKIRSTEKEVMQFYKDLQEWARKHKVDREHICDNYLEY